MGNYCSIDTTSGEFETDPTVYEAVDDFTIKGNSAEVKTNILKPPSDDYELITVLLHTCFDEERKIDVFNGIELEWKNLETQETYQGKAIGSEFSNDTVMYEITNLDYIEKIVWNQHDAIKAPFITNFGVAPKFGKVHEVGAKGVRSKALVNNSSDEVQSELFGLELVQNCNDKQFFISVKAIWREIPERKRVAAPEAATSFFESNKTVNLRVIAKQLAYLYRNNEEAYKEFEALIDPKNGTQEYLGALPVRFLSPEEKTRLDNAINDSNASNLLKELHSRRRFYKQHLPANSNKEVVNFCVHLITKELQRTASPLNLEEISDNIRFLNKIFTGIYNDDKDLWNEVQTAISENLSQFNSLIFKKVISEMSEDLQLQEVVFTVEDNLNEEYSENYQKSCPQNIDQGTITDVDALIEEYIKEARQILVEFHGTLRGQFGTRYIGEPVAEAGKIKTRVNNIIEQEKLEASDAAAKILDYVKGTIVCTDGQEISNTYDSLKELITSKGFIIVQVNNEFKDMSSENWKALTVHIVAFDCLICEIQITLNSMMEIKEVAQYIATLQREKSLYPIVSDYLSHYNKFNSWLKPFLPESKKLQFPERYIRVKGYYTYVDTTEKRGYMDMKLCFMQNGDLTGYGVDPLGEYQIAGTHKNYKSVKWVKTMVNVPNPWSINYEGEFVDTGVMEGAYLVGTTTGNFRLYVGDYEYPALNSGLVRINLKEKARKVLPEREMLWKGRYWQYGKEYFQDFNLTVLTDGTITGSGRDEIDSFKIVGQHDQYKCFSFIKMMDGNSQYGQFSVYYEGFFVDNYIVQGKWNSGGFMGNFRLGVSDDELKVASGNEISQ